MRYVSMFVVVALVFVFALGLATFAAAEPLTTRPIDPIAAEANWRDINDVPLDSYDAALVCTPDAPKMALLGHLLANGKHVLVEKPMHAESDRELQELETVARRTGAVKRCVTDRPDSLTGRRADVAAEVAGMVQRDPRPVPRLHRWHRRPDVRARIDAHHRRRAPVALVRAHHGTRVGLLRSQRT